MKCIKCGNTNGFEKKEEIYSNINSKDELYDQYKGSVNCCNLILVYCIECGKEYNGFEEIEKLFKEE